MKKPTLRPAALLLALLLALSLTACGAETPEQVLKTAGDNLNGADSLGYTLEMAMTLTSGGQDLDVSLTADGETTKDPAVTHTAMAIDLGGLMRADMEMYTEQGGDGSVTVFAGMADSSGDVQWSRQTAAVEDPENLTSTAQGAYSFLAGVADIRENGRETIDGVEATRYDAVVTGETMEALLNATGAMDSLSGSVLNGADPGTLTEDRIVLERHLDVNGREDARVLRYAFLNSYFSTGVKNLIDNAIVERALAEGTDEVNATVGSTTTAEELAERYHGIDELPFDFERRRLSVVVGDAAGHTRMVTKGALEEVLAVCSSVEVDGQVLPLTDELRTQVVRRGEALADEGMRVLGVARKNEPAGAATLTVADERNMVLIGYLAFLDPPKESSAAAIRALAAHGVATKVLTGDSPRVAAHVCRAIGIDAEHVLTGVDVEAMNDGELADAVQRTNIFAKLSPAQKARVVRTLRGLGHAVAYMGDGVNDAAAMRESDCGISVDSAVDVAREAADIILLEKDLMVLERGIECGRRTYANMIKYVKMTVSSNFGNIASVLVAAALLPFLPMTAVQLLLLNLIYDLTCTAIPWDNVDEDAIRTPRRWDTASVRRFMVAFGPLSSVFDILTFAALFFFVCPAVAGGAWGTLDAAGQALFVGTFQAGWFVESMWTQTLVVHLIRTEKVPFVGSRASLPLCALGATGIAVACVLPVTPLGAALDFCALPATFWPILATMVAGYAALAMLAKRRYVRRNGSLL